MSRRSPAKKKAAEDEDDVVIVETPCAVCKKADADTFALSACKHGLHASCYTKVRALLGRALTRPGSSRTASARPARRP